MHTGELYGHRLPMTSVETAAAAARVPVLLDWYRNERDATMQRILKYAILRSLEIIEDTEPMQRDWCNTVRRAL